MQSFLTQIMGTDIESGNGVDLGHREGMLEKGDAVLPGLDLCPCGEKQHRDGREPNDLTMPIFQSGRFSTIPFAPQARAMNRPTRGM